MAEQFGVSTRTIERFMAEPRADFLARAAQRRGQALALKKQGLTYREIAKEMGCSIGAASRLVHDGRRLAAEKPAVNEAHDTCGRQAV